MPDSVFVDTGYILALVNENDQHHAEAVALSEQFDGQPIVVTDAVLLEIGNALSRMDRDAAVQIIEDLRESPGVTVVNMAPELFESAFAQYRRHTDKQWGLVDCVSLVVMHSMGLTTVLAFDQHFVQAGSSHHGPERGVRDEVTKKFIRILSLPLHRHRPGRPATPGAAGAAADRALPRDQHQGRGDAGR